MMGFKVEGLGPAGGCFEAWALHSRCAQYLQSISAVGHLVISHHKPYSTMAPPKWIEYVFGYTIKRSPYTSYSIYLRGTVNPKPLNPKP